MPIPLVHIVGNPSGGHLNPQDMFELWFKLGTLREAQKYLTERNIINPITNKPYSTNTIRNTALRWIIDNPDVLYERYAELGYNISKEDLEKWLVKCAIKVFGVGGRDKFFDWVEKNGFDKYSNIYARKFGLVR